MLLLCSPLAAGCWCAVVIVTMASFGEKVEVNPLEGDLPKERLQLHVRCVPDDDKVQLYLALHDGSTVALNR